MEKVKLDQNRHEVLQIIKTAVVDSIMGFAVRKASSRPRKFQILDLIIPKQRRIRSIVGGMEGSLGSTLWEPLAKALARRNGFEVVDGNLLAPSIMPSSLNNTLQTIKDDRGRNGGLYDAKSSHAEIKRICQTFKDMPIREFKSPPTGRGVDIWLLKEGVNYFFDSKTVQPNVGDFSKFLAQILDWYAYFYSKYPTQSAKARIVFPYNPTPERSFWEGAQGGGGL